MNAVKKINTHT